MSAALAALLMFAGHGTSAAGGPPATTACPPDWFAPETTPAGTDVPCLPLDGILLAAEDRAAPGAAPPDTPVAESARERTLPFLGDLARERGYDLPLPLGVGAVYTYLSRDVEVEDVRVGRNGAPPASVSDFAALNAHSKVDNLNVKFDAWLLPFLNLYAFAGRIKNETDVTIALALPPLVPGGQPRERVTTVPTSLEGSVGGLGTTLAGGYKSLFFAADINVARADLGFDDEFKAVIKSLRVGFNGKAGGRPLRVWGNVTYWDTYFEVKGTVADLDGGTLSFEVDQGPAEPWTYGVGAQYTVRPSFELAADTGWDLQGGWYVAIVPTFRF